MEQLKAGAEVVDQRDIRFKPSGNKIICQYRATPFVGKRGEFLGIIEDFKDITELEIAKDNIKETQKQYETLMNSMPVGVYIRDFDGNMIYQNSYMDKVFGPFNFEKKNIKYIFPSTQVDRFLEEDKYVQRYGSFIVEEQLIDSSGDDRTYVTHKFKFSGANNVLLIGGVSIDISKRKQAEHNYYVLSKAIKNIPIGVLISSPEGVVEFSNPEFEKISGKSNEEILGEIFPPFIEIEESALGSTIKKALSGVVFQEEKSFSLYNNPVNWYSLSVAPVFNRNGSVAHIIFVFDDINQRKESEKEIVIAKTRAEESDKLKTAFLSNLSHEIRTPLNAILGFSSLLNNPTISYDEKLEIPNHLVGHSNTLLEIIDDLIDIAAIETKQLLVKKGECQLNQLLTKTFTEFLKANPKNNLKTYIKLGVAEESFTILTDSDRLSQVIRHLLSNALKFTSNGFVEFGYTFRDASTLLFYVIDTGVGLNSKEQEFVFNPFRQADDSKTRNFNGLGLGLAISKNIIERLGGKIWVNSTKDEGSTFFFTLPYIPVRAKFEEFIVPTKELVTFNWSNKTIMVADDIDSNFKFIQTLLKPTGVNLLWAKNGREAINMAKDKEIDLVLMDIVMPEIDGFEATKQIKQFNNDIKIICQTAYPSPENKQAGIDCGMDKFLAKPIAVYSMMETINDYISKN
jgi:PAS domain S-box-containing protein